MIVSLIAQAAPAADTMTATRTGLIDVIRPGFAMLVSRIAPIEAALPTVPSELAKAIDAIVRDEPGNFPRRLIATVCVLAAMYVCSLLARRIAAQRLAPPDGASAPEAIIRRFGVDLAGALAMLAVALVGTELLIVRAGLSPTLMRSLVDLGALLGLAMIVPAILFRPGSPELRLIPATDRQIRAAYPWLVATLLIGISFPVLIPVILEAGMAWRAGQALAVCVGLVTAVLGVITVARFFRAGEVRGARWRALTLAAGLGFWLAWSYGVITLDFPFYFFCVRLGAIVTVALICDRLLAAGMRPIPEEGTAAFSRFWKTYGRPLQRITYLVTLGAIALNLAHWLAEFDPPLIERARAIAMEMALWRALATFAIGYAAFEILSAWTKARYIPPPMPRPGGEDEEVAPASRWGTVVPVLQGLIGVAILGIAALMALSQLGLDTTPILAGAGILGLAISFGSQSLVRDVVAGVFYMLDDAFRLGEYIEAGRLKGTVERITVRSVQVRHHNGQLHTIPLGQLGAVTNFSRDWLTMKFNLRLARSADFETVRKIAKKVGQELLVDEEFGKEFILPLKLQGVADVEESALVMRFKFTVRPGKPTYVQREAIKRLMRAFADKGIEFAQHAVVVQSPGYEGGPEAAAAAAANVERLHPRGPAQREAGT